MHTRYPLHKTIIVSLVAFGALAALEILAAQAPPSVWDGAYTQAQAKRGEAVYTEKCSQCHGADLTGGDNVAPLSGAQFLSKWNAKTMDDLFERTRSTMPADKPKSLTPQQYSDVLAYILSVNKFPAGNKELDTQMEILKQIRFEATKQ